VGKDEAVMRTYGSSPVKLKFSFHSASEARPTGSDKNPRLAYVTVVAPSLIPMKAGDRRCVNLGVIFQKISAISAIREAERHAFLEIAT
jgi:hypothetical protein